MTVVGLKPKNRNVNEFQGKEGAIYLCEWKKSKEESG
jgi:hypothetical protein